MGRRAAVAAEVVGRGHQGCAEVPPPEVIDRDAGGQRIGPVGDPARQGGAPARAREGIDRAQRRVCRSDPCRGPCRATSSVFRAAAGAASAFATSAPAFPRAAARLRSARASSRTARARWSAACSARAARGAVLEVARRSTEPGVGGVRGDPCGSPPGRPAQVALGKVDVQAQPGRLGPGRASSTRRRGACPRRTRGCRTAARRSAGLPGAQRLCLGQGSLASGERRLRFRQYGLCRGDGRLRLRQFSRRTNAFSPGY